MATALRPITSILHLDHLDPKILAERLPGITQSARLRRSRLAPSAIPRSSDGSLQHGWHPDELSRRGADEEGRRPRSRRSWPYGDWPRRRASRCTRPNRSARTLNRSPRLRSRAAARRCARRRSKRKARNPSCREMAMTGRSPASTSIGTPRAARRQRHCAFACKKPCRRTAPSSARTGAKEGVEKIKTVWRDAADISVTDRR